MNPTGPSLPGLDPNSGHGAIHVDVADGDVRNTGPAVVLAEPTYAYAMARATVQVADVDVGGAGLDRDAVITY